MLGEFKICWLPPRALFPGNVGLVHREAFWVQVRMREGLRMMLSLLGRVPVVSGDCFVGVF